MHTAAKRCLAGRNVHTQLARVVPPHARLPSRDTTAAAAQQQPLGPASKSKPDWVKILEEDAAVDEEVAELLKGTDGDPDKIREKMEQKLQSPFGSSPSSTPSTSSSMGPGALSFEARTGSDTPPHITFREMDPFDLWVWLEFVVPPAQREKELLQSTLKSWFVVGKLGGFNSQNLQVGVAAGCESPYWVCLRTCGHGAGKTCVKSSICSMRHLAAVLCGVLLWAGPPTVAGSANLASTAGIFCDISGDNSLHISLTLFGGCHALVVSKLQPALPHPAQHATLVFASGVLWCSMCHADCTLLPMLMLLACPPVVTRCTTTTVMTTASWSMTVRRRAAPSAPSCTPAGAAECAGTLHTLGVPSAQEREQHEPRTCSMYSSCQSSLWCRCRLVGWHASTAALYTCCITP
jgi:hypothetical protein